MYVPSYTTILQPVDHDRKLHAPEEMQAVETQVGTRTTVRRSEIETTKMIGCLSAAPSVVV